VTMLWDDRLWSWFSSVDVDRSGAISAVELGTFHSCSKLLK
jgi:hypothetical protein